MQFGTVGMKRHQAAVLDALEAIVGPRAIVDRTSPRTAASEGFEAAGGVVRGSPVEALEFHERGLAFRIPMTLGQKTGFYFDQRPLRGRVEYLARNASRVLDAYAFVGAFAMAAARGGAGKSWPWKRAPLRSTSALLVRSETAWAGSNSSETMFVACSLLPAADLVVADPPRLAPTRSSRGPPFLAYSGSPRTPVWPHAPGGHVVLCSCSAAVDLDALTRALATGAVRADVAATVVERAFQGPDHPVPAAFRRGLYLKALVARIDAR